MAETDRATWNQRAALAERAVIDRYGGGFPGVAWARSCWPPVPLLRRGDDRARWHYWWSAHLLDAAIDAARHRPSAQRRRRARAFARGIRLRNGGTLSRAFYDDLAWLGLSLHRGADVLGHRSATEQIAARLESAIDPRVGAVPWQVGSRFFNAPANGPAAILFARTGRADAAARLSDWMDTALRDRVSGLILDGVVIEGEQRRLHPELYTYCQGVALGAAVELSRLPGGTRFADRAAALLDAVVRWTEPSLVLPGAGGGDCGLFAAIACRYLAEAATVLPGEADAGGPTPHLLRAAASARSLVLASAEAVWAGRATIGGLPLFSAEWAEPADPSTDAPERDLSVQLAGWLAIEAAVEVLQRPRMRAR